MVGRGGEGVVKVGLVRPGQLQLGLELCSHIYNSGLAALFKFILRSPPPPPPITQPAIVLSPPSQIYIVLLQNNFV